MSKVFHEKTVQVKRSLYGILQSFSSICCESFCTSLAVSSRINTTGICVVIFASIEDNSAVEVNCVITKNGPKPISVGDLPVAVRGLVQQIKSFERVAAGAAVTGDYNTALLAMTINPLVPSDKVAKQILDEMLEAHKEHLPQFFKKVEA